MNFLRVEIAKSIGKPVRKQANTALSGSAPNRRRRRPRF